MQTTATRYVVRPMDLGDISQVMEIEKDSFPSMWPSTAFKREIRHNRLARYLVAVEQTVQEGETTEGEFGPLSPPGPRAPSAPPLSPPRLGRWLIELRRLFGAEEDAEPAPHQDLVIGFVGVWLIADEAHIVTIAVRESHRRRGVGELMLIAAIELTLMNERELVSLECRVSNDVAIALYDKYGFQRLGIRPHYYSDNREDAVIMTAERIDQAPYQRLFRQLREEHRQRFGEYHFDFT
jgi:ribosomal-protein-alanine N-acetyltransferase